MKNLWNNNYRVEMNSFPFIVDGRLKGVKRMDSYQQSKDDVHDTRYPRKGSLKETYVIY